MKELRCVKKRHALLAVRAASVLRSASQMEELRHVKTRHALLAVRAPSVMEPKHQPWLVMSDARTPSLVFGLLPTVVVLRKKTVNV